MAGIPRTLPEIIRKAVSGALSDVHIALPGKVVSWDPTKNLADVQVMVQHAVYDDDNVRTYEDIGTLAGVPVMWPRAGGFVMSLPMTAGDTGLLVFCSAGIGEWRSSNQSSQPADASRHDIGWPVFVPGLFADVKLWSAGDPHGSKAIWGKDGGEQIQSDGTSIQIGANAVKPATFGDVNDTNWTANKVLALAMNVFAGAVSTYAAAVQAIADPTNAATPTLTGAATTLQGACNTFSSAVLPTFTAVCKVK